MLGGTGIRVSTHCLGTMMFGCVGEHQTSRDASGTSTPRSTAASTSSTPPTSIPNGESEDDRRRGASRAAATMSSWPRSSTTRWVLDRTSAGTPGSGSCGRSRRAFVGWAPITSTSTRCIGPRRRPRSRRPSRPSPTCNAPARSGRSDARRSRAGRSCRRSGRPSAEGSNGSERNSPLTRSSRGMPKTTCSPWPRRTGWGCWCGRPSAEGGSPGATAGKISTVSLRLSSDADRAERGGPVAAQFDLERREIQSKLDIVERLVPIAEEAGISMAHMAVAFMLAHPGVTSAIVGPRTPAQIEDLIAGAGRATRRRDARRDRCRRAAGIDDRSGRSRDSHPGGSRPRGDADPP